MIKFYTGTPGSGKSLHSIKLIVAYLQAGKNVISNFPLKVDLVPDMVGRYYYVDNEAMTVPYLRTFAALLHEEEQENQTLLVIDEASVKFNSRTFNAVDRLEFCGFFAQHRKYGYEVVVISQTLRQVDRQIRDLCEIEVVHRKLNNYSLWRMLPFSLFAAIERNITVKQKNGHELFLYDRKIGALYDTFYDFTQNGEWKMDEAVLQSIENSEIQRLDAIPMPSEPETAGNEQLSLAFSGSDSALASGGGSSGGPAAGDARPPFQEAMDQFFAFQDEES